MTNRLPYADLAVLDIRKIADYCLNPRILVAVTRPGFSDRPSTLNAAIPLGWGMLYWRPHAPPRRP
jgi:hypothetical protein